MRFRGEPRELAAALFMSLGLHLVAVVIYKLLLMAVGLRVPMIELLAIVPWVLLIGLIPISFNGLGLSEGAFVLLSAQSGLNPGADLAVAVLVRLVVVAGSLFGGVLLLWETKLADIETLGPAE